MKVSDLFDLKYGVNLELLRCEKAIFPEGLNFVSRTSQNNGVTARVKHIEGIQPQKAGTISVAVSGSVLSAFVQNEPYYSGRDLYVLTPKIDMSFEEKLFYTMLINKNAYRYSYGRAANKTLPYVDIPDIKQVREIIKDYKFVQIKSTIENSSITIKVNQWKQFKISDLFIVKGSKTTVLDELYEYGEGKYPYVTTQATNNGVAGYYNIYTEEGNVLTVDSAVSGYCSYQNLPFTASDHVEVLVPKFEMDVYIALFFVTLLNKEQYRYSYGRKSNQIKIKNTLVKLPVNHDGNIDFEYIRRVMKSLKYSDLIKKQN